MKINKNFKQILQENKKIEYVLRAKINDMTLIKELIISKKISLKSKNRLKKIFYIEKNTCEKLLRKIDYQLNTLKQLVASHAWFKTKVNYQQLCQKLIIKHKLLFQEYQV